MSTASLQPSQGRLLCELIFPPSEICPMDPVSIRAVDLVPAYETHPAYAEFSGNPGFALRVRAILVFSRYFLVVLTKRLIDYELIPAHVRKDSSMSGRLRFFGNALRNCAGKLKPRRRGTNRLDDKSIEAQLARNGIAVIRVQPAHFAELERLSASHFENLRQRRGSRAEGGREFDESRTSAQRTSSTQLFELIERVLQEIGALDAVSTHTGRTARLVDVNPQVNDTSDDFWKRIFPDLPADTRPVKYMHRDASGGDIKAIFYMSDVGPHSGPFSYVLGSHRVRSNNLLDWIEEANDQGILVSTTPEARRLFAALPRALRRKCSMGNDMRPGDPATPALLKSEWTIEAPRGHVVLFDTKGLHRGGLVEKGERLVITCVTG
jgi:hypothetical protein